MTDLGTKWLIVKLTDKESLGKEQAEVLSHEFGFTHAVLCGSEIIGMCTRQLHICVSKDYVHWGYWFRHILTFDVWSHVHKCNVWEMGRRKRKTVWGKYCKMNLYWRLGSNRSERRKAQRVLLKKNSINTNTCMHIHPHVFIDNLNIACPEYQVCIYIHIYYNTLNPWTAL